MERHACSALDDYLADDLGEDDRALFVEHLAACADCRRAVDEQQRLSVLLATATARLDHVPAGLFGRVEGRLWSVRRRRMTGVALAIAASVAALWLLGRRVEPDMPSRVSPPLAGVSGSTEPLGPPHVRVTFPAAARLSAVPVETDSPNVTVYWVIPAPERSER
jgi:hypothetical protein